jgi:hypothetical protein
MVGKMKMKNDLSPREKETHRQRVLEEGSPSITRSIDDAVVLMAVDGDVVVSVG